MTPADPFPLLTTGTCVEGGPRLAVPTACDWRLSADAFVLGDVRAIAWADDALAITGRTGDQEVVDPDGCAARSGVNDGALVLTLAVALAWGGVEDGLLDVRLGVGHWTRLAPTPSPDDDTPLAALVGMRIGALVHDVDGRASLMHEPLLAVVDGGVVVQEVQQPCDVMPAPDVDGLAVADLVRALQTCGEETTPVAAERADLKARVWLRPSETYAGICYLPDG